MYGATATSAFALEEKTGKQLWSVSLVRNANEGIDMAPGYHNGIVYVATVPGQQHHLLRCRRRRHPVGAGRGDRQEAVALRHRARKPVVLRARQHQLRRRGVVHARVRRTGLHVLRHRQPGALPQRARVPVGFEPARSEPVHRLAHQDERHDRQAAVVLPGHPARPLRPRPRGPSDPLDRRRQAGGADGNEGRICAGLRTPDRAAAVEAPSRHPQRSRQRQPLRAQTRILQAQAAGDGLPRSAGRRDRADVHERHDGLRARRQHPHASTPRKAPSAGKAHPSAANWSR